MIDSQLKQEANLIHRTTQFSMVVNFLLAATKLLTGYIVGSLVLIADGLDSFLDIVSALVVGIGASIGVKPADADHHYGHGKFETFSALIIDVVLIIAGLGIIWSGLNSFTEPLAPRFGNLVIIIAVFSSIVKLWLSFYIQHVSKEVRSEALKAFGWNIRTDSYMGVIVIAGGISAALGYPQGDKLAAIIFGIIVLSVGARLLYKAIFDLTEGSPGEEEEKQLIAAIESFSEVKGWHKLRVRRNGRELIMDVHVLLDQDMSIKSGHDIVKKIENEVQTQLEWPVNLTIHIDPTSDDIISARQAAGDKTLRLE